MRELILFDADSKVINDNIMVINDNIDAVNDNIITTNENLKNVQLNLYDKIDLAVGNITG